MTKINYKSILIGIAHSVIIPFILVYVSQNLLIGLAYYLIPLAAYETFATQKEESKAVFYTISIFISLLLLIAMGGM
ncbi:hypothetical protein ACNSOL_00020 [Aliarcobacter lanthieri]|uniref:hypothetical protein n=1 Tax=Aliarcobacter lanthieri TaxID=1355374 RepID=UPI003AAEDB59